MKRASTFLRKGKIFIQGYSQTTTGLWVGMGAVHVIDETQADELTARIRDAINGSTQGVPHPVQSEWKNIQAPILDAAGVKTWTTFAKGAKAVGMECEAGIIKMTPTSHYENKGGAALSEKIVQCELSDPELGNRLLMAFRSCE